LRLTQVDRLEQIPLLLKTIRELVTPHIASAMMSEAQYRALMERRIALCYLLHSGDRPCAVVIGIRSSSTYHVHNIIYDQTLASYSPGTSLLHLATRQLIETEHMSLIDYGYGDPGHSQQSSNVTKRRSQVFVYRRTWTNRMRLAAYSSFGALVDWGKRVNTGLTKVLMVGALPFS
jgi:CelD/BcsL family acetyltransferase involved in cellulose biosynthesis